MLTHPPPPVGIGDKPRGKIVLVEEEGIVRGLKGIGTRLPAVVQAVRKQQEADAEDLLA
jgi:hypothetical protein